MGAPMLPRPMKATFMVPLSGGAGSALATGRGEPATALPVPPLRAAVERVAARDGRRAGNVAHGRALPLRGGHIFARVRFPDARSRKSSETYPMMLAISVRPSRSQPPI